MAFLQQRNPPLELWTKKDPAPGRVKWQLPFGQTLDY
jgi:hypothetical protein